MNDSGLRRAQGSPYFVSLTQPADNQLTVVIATRDRGDSISATLESVLAAGADLARVIVIDQSEKSDTEAAVRAWGGDPRLHYERSATRGLSAARNAGLDLAATDAVLMTDDDCVVPAGYAARVLEVFAANPKVALIFFQVDPAPFDPAAGFTPAFTPVSGRLLTRLAQLSRASGIGAGLALRRRAAQSAGGFDPLLGAGGKFRSAEDIDLTVRLLLAGHHVLESAALKIIHHGFRTNDQFKVLVRRDWYGIGAAYAKPLRCGRGSSFAPVIAADVWRRSLRPFLANMVRLRPRGAASLVAFAQGMSDGFRQPLDRATLLYRER